MKVTQISSVLLMLGAMAVQAQNSSSTAPAPVSATAAPTFRFNSASTDIIISTAAPQTADVSSASGTIKPVPSAYPYVNVSSLPASLATSSANRTASSNFTLPSATATATLSPGFRVQNSVPYVMQDISQANLPSFKYSLLNESQASREQICQRQTQFCQTAGCAKPGAKIDQNFCNVETMGTRCTCDSGSSNLQQYNWPVQMADCLNRGTTCATTCSQPGGTTAQRQACKTACEDAFSATCGYPGQYGANYAVNKESQKPGLSMVQGGTAGSGAMALKAASGFVISIACIATLALL